MPSAVVMFRLVREAARVLFEIDERVGGEAMRTRAFLSGVTDGNHRRDSNVRGKSEQRLHLLRLEAKHRRRGESHRFSEQQEVAQRDVRLLVAPILSLFDRLIGELRSEARDTG